MKYYVLTFSIFSLISACQKKEGALNKFHDPTITIVADLQDRRSSDSILLYLKHANSTYRGAAALAFASIQDSNYVQPLRNVLLSDDDPQVRMAAAYAIGQTFSLQSEEILFEASARESDGQVLAEIIRAYGKVARKWKLKITPRDSITAIALGWGYYRMAVRGVSDNELNNRAGELLRSAHSPARLAASHYFARGAKDFDRFEKLLSTLAVAENLADVRMAATLALGKINSDSSLFTLITVAKEDPDDRVRTNAIRSLQNFGFDQTREALIKALDDKSVNVAIAASETIKSDITGQYVKEVHALARSVANWRVQANLYGAVLSVLDNKEILDEIESVYNKSTNPYQQAALLTSLEHASKSYNFVHKQLLERKEPVVKSSAASALVSMNYKKNFDGSLKHTFASLYQQAIREGDVAVTGIICGALSDSTLNYKSVLKDFSFLKEARSKLALPKDYESVVPLENAIAYFEGRKSYPAMSNDFNHPINWNIVRKIPSDQKAIIKTSKGNITMKLLVDEAPGSVLNFILLATEKYYDGKTIHRVAPNFVVQDGCPRGDGWGSEAYSIRSEFAQHRYKTGSVGMASAGKDTEGTQWFITHSPTPHLEGRYTLFAEVENGINVVNALEVGDRINSVEIIDFTPL